MNSRSAVVLVFGFGCGRIGFDIERTGILDAADASDAAPACTSFGQWSTPTPIAGVNSGGIDFGSQISGDGLTLQFDSDRNGNDDLFVTTRATREAAFATPVPIVELNTGTRDADPSMSPDGLELFFTSTRTAPHACLFVATRAIATAMWDPPRRLDALCATADIGGAYVTADDRTLFYNTSLDVAAEGRILVSERNSRLDEFSPGVPVAGLAGAANGGYPALSGDGLTLYFELEVGPRLAIHQISRPSVDQPFAGEIAVPDISATGDDGDASITADGTELVFASTRGGNNDLYHSTRSCQ